MSADPTFEIQMLRAEVKALRSISVAHEATIVTVMLEMIDVLVERKVVEPEEIRARFFAMADGIMKVPEAPSDWPRDIRLASTEPGVRLVQQMAAGIEQRHKLTPRKAS